jgi:dTMP kinase
MTAGPVYIAFEGAEGSGKSTQAGRLADRIGAVLTRAAGGTDLGAFLRDTAVHELAPRAEALITAAERAQHMTAVVRPALAAGRAVVSDRAGYSSIAYQGYGREVDLDRVRTLNDWAIEGLWPDFVVLLDTPDEMIAERMSRRNADRFEAAGRAFHERVVEGFRLLAIQHSDHWITIEAVGTIDHVAEHIFQTLSDRGVV